MCFDVELEDFVNDTGIPSQETNLQIYFCFSKRQCHCRTRDIATTLARMNGPGFKYRQEQQIYSLLQNVQTGSGAHPGSYSMGTEFPSCGKAAEA